MIFNKTLADIDIEPWFIPLDIVMIIATALSVALLLIFLFIIILNKTCHTIPMMLVANTCLAQLVFGSDMLATAVFTFQNDLKQSQYHDSLCIFRGFLGYIVTVLQNYSYLLQAMYRYITVVYPTRLFYQSVKFQIFLICLIWIWGVVCPIPYVLTGGIHYNSNNQICQLPLGLSFLNIYNALCVYAIPVSLTMFIYFKLVRYVQEMSKRVTHANALSRAQRELKMVRRIMILVLGVTTIGFPYALFVFISLFATPPQYHFRIAYIFVDASLAFVLIATFQFTEPFKTFIMQVINGGRNVIVPMITRS